MIGRICSGRITFRSALPISSSTDLGISHKWRGIALDGVGLVEQRFLVGTSCATTRTQKKRNNDDGSRDRWRQCFVWQMYVSE